jgi:hypothetical protein
MLNRRQGAQDVLLLKNEVDTGGLLLKREDTGIASGKIAR